MKVPRYSDSEIMTILRQAEAGISASELCKEHGMSSVSFYKWKEKFGGIDALMVTRRKGLEDENLRLKKIYAEERMKAEIIQKAMAKKLVSPP